MSITKKNPFKIYEMNEYVEFISDIIGRLDGEIVIHRLTGDGARKDLFAPRWTLMKKRVLSAIHQNLKEKDIYQGKHLL